MPICLERRARAVPGRRRARSAACCTPSRRPEQAVADRLSQRSRRHGEAGPAGPAQTSRCCATVGLTRHFRARRAVLQAGPARRRRPRPHDQRARDRGARRRERQRQEHRRPAAGAHLQADHRRDLLPRPPGAGACARARTCSGTAARSPIVLQDPFSAFHPVFRMSHGIMRNLALHRPELSRDERRREAERVCEAVGLSPRMLTRLPV